MPLKDMVQNMIGLQALKEGRQRIDAERQRQEGIQVARDALQRYSASLQEGSPDYESLYTAALNSPELSQNMLSAIGIRDRQQGIDAANYAARAGAVIDNPEQFLRISQNRVKYLSDSGRDPSDTIALIEQYRSGDMDGAKKNLQAASAALVSQGYLDKDIYATTFGVGTGKGLGSTQILDDGTTIQASPTGPIVFSSSGQRLTGQAATDAIRRAQDYGAQIQAQRAGGRTAATLDARVAGGGEAQRVEATGSEEGKTAVARRDAWKTQALGAAENIPTLRRAIELQEQINTGGGINAIRRVANYLGVASEDEGELNSLFGQNILGQLKSTFGGNPTEGEREALAQAQASFNQTGKINSRLLKNALKLAEQRVQRGKRAAQADKDDATIQEIDAAMAINLGENEGGSGKGVNTPSFAPPAATQGWSIKPLGQ